MLISVLPIAVPACMLQEHVSRPLDLRDTVMQGDDMKQETRDEA